MSRSATSPASAGRPRKSPLRLATVGEPSFRCRTRNGHLSPPQLRAMMISEFEQWLRSRTNKEKRPFQEETILAYAKAARALDAWMTDAGVDGDFTACDTALLNRFFRDYNDAHTRGGTNTKQRNLRHLFTWLEADYDHPHPYTDELNRYAPAAGRPSTLSADFIRDLLAVTGGGHGKAFADVRDHALIRVLTEGLRRTEVTEMRMTDLPLDLVEPAADQGGAAQGRPGRGRGARGPRRARPPPGPSPPTCGRAAITGWRTRRSSGWGCGTAGRSTGRACTGCCAGGPSRPATSPRCTRTCSGTPSPTTGCPTAALRAT